MQGRTRNQSIYVREQDGRHQARPRWGYSFEIVVKKEKSRNFEAGAKVVCVGTERRHQKRSRGLGGKREVKTCLQSLGGGDSEVPEGGIQRNRFSNSSKKVNKRGGKRHKGKTNPGWKWYLRMFVYLTKRSGIFVRRNHRPSRRAHTPRSLTRVCLQKSARNMSN